MRVGIPRALLYYEYGAFWTEFLTRLGATVVLSAPTNAATVAAGTRLAVDEACLPVKLFFGHVADLADRVDAVWVPRVVSVERREYTCPKFMGLPDMVRSAFPGLEIIATTVDLLRGPGRLHRAAVEAGRRLGAGAGRSLAACRQAVAAHRSFLAQLEAGFTAGEALGCEPPDGAGCLLSGAGSRIALLGHSYIVHDPRAGMGIGAWLQRRGYQVVTAETVPAPAVTAAAAGLPKPLFWTYEKRVLGAAYYLLGRGLVDGIVQLVSFGCGPDSIAGELIEKEAGRRRRVPYMMLTLDEHSGAAGVHTRLEAFLDMLQRRSAEGARA